MSRDSYVDALTSGHNGCIMEKKELVRIHIVIVGRNPCSGRNRKMAVTNDVAVTTSNRNR